MLGNCEKMVLISSPSSNQWPQNNNKKLDEPKVIFNNNMASSLGAGLAERVVMDHKATVVEHEQDTHQHQHQHQEQHLSPPPQQQQQKAVSHQEQLRCPRCDSSNTKFCYYNNYSLSQPRHFCKACKRYWTRGGTLRNVPVGGGCRKNKRVKRPPNINASSSSSTSLTNNNNNGATNFEASVNEVSSGGAIDSLSSGGNGSHIHDLMSSSSNHPLFYGLPTNHSPNSDINFPFSRYDLQNPPQINGLGLGFSSGLVHNMNNMNIHNHPHHHHHNNNNNTKQIFQDLISSNPLLSNYSTTTNTITTTSPPTISSLLASSLHQMKGGNNSFQTLLPSYGNDLHMKGNGQSGNSGGMFMKEEKMEFEGQNRNHHWNNPSSNQQPQMNQQPMGQSSDPSILWGSTTGSNLGAWLDPSNNLGSSVPSLI